ncbi:MAG: helix-turn-helix domain-containing protein [Halanaeroarchaeum sp.]
MEADTSIVLETMVPLGERSVPFFRVYGGRDSFERSVRDHATVSDIQVINTDDGETLYALDWDVSTDKLFEGISKFGATLQNARGTGDTWEFELRFPSHDDLSAFQEYCVEVDLPIEVDGLYNPTKPDAGPWYGLTPPQHEALTRAVESGYYSIPRETSTQELAAEFGISDQALTERLRRAVINLVSNTLFLSAEEAGSAGV